MKHLKKWFHLEDDHLPPLQTLAIISFSLMIASMPLFLFSGGIGEYIREYVGLIWHISMFFFIMKLPVPAWGKVAGSFWIVLDVLSGMLYLNNFYGVVSDPTLGIVNQGPFTICYITRLAAHIFEGTWLISSALTTKNKVIKGFGVLAGVLLAGYSFLSPFVPTWVFSLNSPFMIVWFFIIAIGKYEKKPKDIKVNTEETN